MAVPVQLAGGGVGAVEELYEAHAFLDQAPGKNAVLGVVGLDLVLGVIRAVHFEDVLRLGGKIADLRDGQLHPGGQFVAGNAGGEIGVLRIAFEVLIVQQFQQVARGHVGLVRDGFRRLQVLNRLLGIKGCALENGGQESGPPIIDAGLRDATRIGNGDKGGQVFVFGSEGVGDPRAHAGKTIEGEAGGNEILSGPVRVRFAGERMDEGVVIRHGGKMRHHVGAHFAGLAVRTKFVLRPGEIASGALKGYRRSVLQRLSVVFDQFGFVVPSFQLAAGAGAKDDQHVLGFGRVMRWPRGVWSGGVNRRLIRQEALFA